jgi:hypothetical protein
LNFIGEKTMDRERREMMAEALAKRQRRVSKRSRKKTKTESQSGLAEKASEFAQSVIGKVDALAEKTARKVKKAVTG